MHSQKSPHDPTRLVSRSCHDEAVANVDFKLYRSRKTRRKIESSSSEAKNRLNWSVISEPMLFGAESRRVQNSSYPTQPHSIIAKYLIDSTSRELGMPGIVVDTLNKTCDG